MFMGLTFLMLLLTLLVLLLTLLVLLLILLVLLLTFLLWYTVTIHSHANSHSFDHYTGDIGHYLTNPSRTHPTQSAPITADPPLRPTPNLTPWTSPHCIECHH